MNWNPEPNAQKMGLTQVCNLNVVAHLASILYIALAGTDTKTSTANTCYNRQFDNASPGVLKH